MKIKRHPNKLPIKVLSTALALSLTVNFATTVAVVDRGAAAKQAISVAERAVSHADYYRNRFVDLQVTNDELKGENQELKRTLSTYTGEYLELYAEMPPRYLAEMFCDRVAASKTYKKELYTDASPLEYFLTTKEKHLMHPKTEEILLLLLTMLRDRGEANTFAYIRNNILKHTKNKPK